MIINIISMSSPSIPIVLYATHFSGTHDTVGARGHIQRFRFYISSKRVNVLLKQYITLWFNLLSTVVALKHHVQ